MTAGAVLELTILALVSLAFGSFVAALSLRLPAGETILGRSHCPHCRAQIAARDLVPVLNWLWLKGRCRSCGTPLGAYDPAVELAALALGLWAWATNDGWLVWVSSGFAWTLLALALVDARHFVLPDVLTLPLGVAGLAVAAIAAPAAMLDHVAGTVAGYLAFTAIGWAYRRWRDRDGLGAGDAKLLAASGAWVGLSGLPSVVLLAALLALAAVLAARLSGRRTGLADRVPFGPALAAAAWLVWLYGPPGLG